MEQTLLECPFYAWKRAAGTTARHEHRARPNGTCHERRDTSCTQSRCTQSGCTQSSLIHAYRAFPCQIRTHSPTHSRCRVRFPDRRPARSPTRSRGHAPNLFRPPLFPARLRHRCHHPRRNLGLNRSRWRRSLRILRRSLDSRRQRRMIGSERTGRREHRARRSALRDHAALRTLIGEVPCLVALPVLPQARRRQIPVRPALARYLTQVLP